MKAGAGLGTLLARRSIGAEAIEILQGELGERRELPVGELLSRARRSRAVRPSAVAVSDEIRVDRER